ncbi:MAG: hypothetical protein U0796_09045 [Gemmatales bacterium]
MARKLSEYCYWLLRTVALSLVVLHTVLTWQLFGNNLSHLLEETPMAEGQHARLQYFGKQVAESVRLEGITATTFDYRLQAGLTISPWASIESRLALLANMIAPNHPLATYKVLLFIMWLSLPWSLWFMCRVGNLGSGAIIGALLLFLGSAWSPWGLQLLKQGETDVIIGTAALGLALAHMVRSYARPRWWTMLGWFGSSAVSLYFWPSTVILLVICFILFLGLLAGRLPWARFIWLILSLFGAIAINAFWMRECYHTWWMLADRELLVSNGIEEYFNIKANLQLMLWPGLLLVVGFLGTRTMREGIGGRSALVWSFAIVLTATAALLPQEIEALHLDKMHGWWWCSVWLATIPVGKLLAYIMEHVSRMLGSYQRAMLVFTVLLGTLGGLFQDELARLVVQVGETSSLTLHPPKMLQESIEKLHQHTTDEARILWEEVKGNASWSPLLACQAQRSFVGTLGRAEQVLIEPLQVRLTNGALQGKPIELWRNSDLVNFATDWNIGWVAAFHNESITRWKQLQGARVVASLPLGGVLIRLDRPFTYCKQGQAELAFVEPRRLTLHNLVPDNGQVVLSLHYHATMRTSNNKVSLETWQQAYDGIPMLKLRLSGPMERLTIEW